MASITRSILFAQVGSREHYQIPACLHEAGLLAGLVTDLWTPRWLRRSGMTRRIVPELSTRGSDRIPDSAVDHLGLTGITSYLQRRKAVGREALYAWHMKLASRVSELAAWRLSKQPEVTTGCSFTGSAFELFTECRRRNVRTILDQYDPGPLEDQLILSEALKWPDWASGVETRPTWYHERVAQELALADTIIVASAWSKECLVNNGVPVGKIRIVPLVYDVPAVPPRAPRNGSFTVLYLGTVNLRKGVHYLVEAARRLHGADIRIIIAGPIAVSPKALQGLPSNVEVVGPVPRARVHEYYDRADVFILPSISEGFGLTQLEALSRGLPVITTPRCGGVVTHGQDGLIVNPCDADAIHDAILTLSKDPARVAAMSEQALKTCRLYGREAFLTRLKAPELGIWPS